MRSSTCNKLSLTLVSQNDVLPVSDASSFWNVHNVVVVIQRLKEQLRLEDELHKTPVTLEELKQVLNVINSIRTTSMNMELRYVDLEERFRQACLFCGTWL